MRCTEETLTPAASAIAAPVQCVASATGGSIVSVTTRSATAGSSFGMRDGLVLSRSSPSKPSSAKRSCQRGTRSGLARLAHDRARADPFRGQHDDPCSPDVLLRGIRSLTSARSRSRSAEETERVTPARIPQTRTPKVRSKSLIGFKCQI